MITNYHDPILDEDTAYQQWAEQRAEEQFAAYAEYCREMDAAYPARQRERDAREFARTDFSQ